MPEVASLLPSNHQPQPLVSLWAKVLRCSRLLSQKETFTTLLNECLMSLASSRSAVDLPTWATSLVPEQRLELCWDILFFSLYCARLTDRGVAKTSQPDFSEQTNWVFVEQLAIGASRLEYSKMEISAAANLFHNNSMKHLYIHILLRRLLVLAHIWRPNFAVLDPIWKVFVEDGFSDPSALAFPLLGDLTSDISTLPGPNDTSFVLLLRIIVRFTARTCTLRFPASEFTVNFQPTGAWLISGSPHIAAENAMQQSLQSQQNAEIVGAASKFLVGIPQKERSKLLLTPSGIRNCFAFILVMMLCLPVGARSRLHRLIQGMLDLGQCDSGQLLACAESWSHMLRSMRSVNYDCSDLSLYVADLVVAVKNMFVSALEASSLMPAAPVFRTHLQNQTRIRETSENNLSASEQALKTIIQAIRAACQSSAGSIELSEHRLVFALQPLLQPSVQLPPQLRIQILASIRDVFSDRPPDYLDTRSRAILSTLFPKSASAVSAAFLPESAIVQRTGPVEPTQGGNHSQGSEFAQFDDSVAFDADQLELQQAAFIRERGQAIRSKFEQLAHSLDQDKVEMGIGLFPIISTLMSARFRPSSGGGHQPPGTQGPPRHQQLQLQSTTSNAARPRILQSTGSILPMDVCLETLQAMASVMMSLVASRRRSWEYFFGLFGSRSFWLLNGTQGEYRQVPMRLFF
eukprot:TRINITY_DN5796_c0_g2_i2.p1 TRINITY_DN5796_c0_g2~~TRINITY_DN5796_c0_g2_i2.p1  ORF type:complete len:689 (-),score=93.28 TRINITY_DN5796_c0_g2_i2:1601-3667(-)